MRYDNKIHYYLPLGHISFRTRRAAASFAVVTSREKLIPGAPKMLIPGEFGFASDLHAGGNVLSLANLLYAPVIQKLSLANLLYAPVLQKLSLANLLCAPGIKVIPGELESGPLGIKIQKIQKNHKNVKKILKF
jgi:hypothetical protein